MKIKSVDLLMAHIGRRNYCFVKVQTDDDLFGIGEAYSVGPDLATREAVKDFESWLIGQDPLRIEHLWAMMYNGTRFPPGPTILSAISGIEHALWDIKGKALGVPVWQLLGGAVRDKVRVYQNPGGGTPEEVAERGVAIIEKYGYTALKIGPQPPGSEKLPWNAVVRGAAARMKGLREAVGPDIDIGLDPHAKIFEPYKALQMAHAVAEWQPFFFEEAIRPENIDAMASLKRQSPIPIATGECLYTKFEFRELLAREAADIIQPDVCLMGGLMEMKKIAAMAEAHYVVVAPHNPMGPVATAVNVHFAASTPNFVVLEYNPDDSGPRREIVKEPLVVKDGYIDLPTKPGLGIELNEEAFAKYPYAPWRRTNAIRPDGSIGFN
ncbi:MAG: Gluconate dehydratase [uncultured Chloroflexi bacterium]|uniref:Gluconate dehydratase n=1 Tax=uncultured Chloroflexota bacterium TaxID=166587 RepID=A0A6J4JKG1_9CHLR|nr:MAG: Gluconate dehydratase [uncultured Chloroflexota bacterium]